MHKEKFIHYLQHEKRYSPHTIKSYNTDLQQFVAFLASEFQIQSPRKVNFQFVRTWIINLLNNNISSRSVNRKITTLKTYFRFLMREGIVEISPMQKVISPKTSKRLAVFVEEIKMDELLNEIDFEAYAEISSATSTATATLRIYANDGPTYKASYT